MPNTVIALKKSATPSATPTSLANGELAINFADGKLYYKHANGTILSISGSGSGGDSFGTVNANSTLIVADTSGDVLTLIAGDNISIVGDAINDTVTVGLKGDVVIPSSGTLKVAAVGGDEGGEIKLGNAVTNSVLTGDIIIDVYQNKLRFFESIGTNRGAFINLAAAAAGVGTDLLAGGSAVDTVARDQANTARDQANTARDHANVGFGQANTSRDHANVAFAQANTARNHANAAFAEANTAETIAIAAFTHSNTNNNFLALADTPDTYSGNASFLVAVNSLETGLAFINQIEISDLVLNAMIAPTSVANDSVEIYVTASGSSPNREVALKLKNEIGDEVTISTVLV